MVEAMYYEKKENGRVQCLLCPQGCIIDNERYGACRSRKNIDGTLYSTIFGKVAAIHMDPIEKKPLYHFEPGSTILSVGTTGCNLHCEFCQNYQISQIKIEDTEDYREFSPEGLSDFALEMKGNIGIAFTYNEPFIWYEFVLETAKAAKKKGLKTVMVTNGYVSKEPLSELNEYIDAYSVDVKSYDNYLYGTLAGGRIEPVIESVKYMIESGKHVEIDYLVIPGYNDNPEKFESFMGFYKENFGEEIVLHINRYFPRYKMRVGPPTIESMNTLKEIAIKYLKNVYLGNI